MNELVVQVWKNLFELGESEKGRGEITEAMRVCPDLLKSSDDVAALADWASSAWDYMASLDFPSMPRLARNTVAHCRIQCC